MSDRSPPAPISDAVRERAAGWSVRLASEDAGEADWLAFEAWLAEAPAHLRAYEAIERAWIELDAAPSSARGNVASLSTRGSRRTAVWGGAIAAGFAAVAVTGAMVWSGRPTTDVFVTPPGQRRVIALDDGSRITLNGGSRLTVTMSRRERRVEMADAEAVFDVVHDPSRPFYVSAGNREIRDVGTEFNVLSHKGAVAVAVRRGSVEVRVAGDRSAPPIARLSKGQALRHRPDARADTVSAADPDAAMAWTTGRLVFQGERLADVAETLSRYGGRPIDVSPEARGLKVTATLNIASQDAMLGTVAEFLPVRVDRQADKVRISLRR